jgi:hypothetical protein
MPIESDHRLLVRKSRECRGTAARAAAPEERARWIMMAELFLWCALQLDDDE